MPSGIPEDAGALPVVEALGVDQEDGGALLGREGGEGAGKVAASS